jgi:hypothetical protein
MYINNLPLRTKLLFFLGVATLLSFIVHFAASFTIANEMVFFVIGIIFGVFFLVLLIMSAIAKMRER